MNLVSSEYKWTPQSGGKWLCRHGRMTARVYDLSDTVEEDWFVVVYHGSEMVLQTTGDLPSTSIRRREDAQSLAEAVMRAYTLGRGDARTES